MAPESRFHTLLKHKVLAVISGLEGEVTAGAASDYSDYKYLVGNLAGLRQALSLCEETEREFDV